MSRRKREPIPPARLDYRMIARQGDAFVRLAEPTIRVLRTDLASSARQAALDITAVVSAATLLALGTELLLKAIYAGRQRPIPEIHEISQLFAGLEDPIRNDLERRYNVKLASMDKNAASALEIDIREEGAEPPAASTREPAPPDYRLTPLLARSSSAFVVWRYFHESVPHSTESTLRVFEHTPLLLFADCLREFLAANALPKPSGAA